MGVFNKIWRKRWKLRALFPSVVFNLRHLPFSQAWRLPILLYKADLLDTSGRFLISGPVRFGMIRLGVFKIGIFPNNGIAIQNSGTIVFRGRTTIGNNSALSIGETGVLELGDNFVATSGLKLICYHSVTAEENVLIGWNTQVTDTDLHALKIPGGGNAGAAGRSKSDMTYGLPTAAKYTKTSPSPTPVSWAQTPFCTKRLNALPTR